MIRRPGVASLVVAALAIALPRVAPAQAAPVVADTLAARHVGEVVTVEGTVARVKVGKHMHTTYLNFGADYPNHTFSAWIPDSAVGAFPGLERLEGRRVRVTGKVFMQDDKWPAVVLTTAGQLEALPPTP